MNLVFFLEERSAKEMLKGLLPRVLTPSVDVTYIVFEGKHDMEKNIVRRLRRWNRDSIFVVLRDQDHDDCRVVKSRLRKKCDDAGRPECIVRIACRELESWYFGDLDAVEKGLGLSNLVKHEKKRKYRNPDDIAAPAKELSRLTDDRYQKLLGSRAIGRELSLRDNRSRSFTVFLDTLRRLCPTPQST